MKHLPIGAVESCPLGITGGTARKPLYADNSRHTSVGLDSLWTSYPQLGSSVKRSIVNGFVYVTKRACPVAESTEHSSFVNVTVVLNSRKSRSRPVSTHFMPLTKRYKPLSSRRKRRDFHVGYQLGTVRYHLVTLRLANAANGEELWGDQYDRNLTELFSREDEISHEVSQVPTEDDWRGGEPALLVGTSDGFTS